MSEQSPYDDGYDAYLYNHGHRNPYPRGSDEETEWFAGWGDAEDERLEDEDYWEDEDDEE